MGCHTSARAPLRAGVLSGVLLLSLGLVFLPGCGDDDDDGGIFSPVDMPYNLTFDPADFEDTNLTGNEYFPMVPGTVQIYEGEEEDGEVVRVESEVLNETKVVAGVTCAVFEVTEFEDGELTEKTRDWYAQDKQGNVWYFGELVENYEDGAFADNSGSWEAGLDGALPGLFMLANPIVGLWYRQEYRPGEAEDVAQIQEVGLTVTVAGVVYNDCIMIAEWNPLERGILENDYYAPDVGSIREQTVKGESDYVDLIEMTTP